MVCMPSKLLHKLPEVIPKNLAYIHYSASFLLQANLFQALRLQMLRRFLNREIAYYTLIIVYEVLFSETLEQSVTKSVLSFCCSQSRFI